MTVKRITVAADFSDTPGGRFREDGPYSGQRFREEWLLPALRERDKVEVDFAGVEGFGSSFLEEAFGGIVREGYFTSSELRTKLALLPVDSTYASEVWSYIEGAK